MRNYHYISFHDSPGLKEKLLGLGVPEKHARYTIMEVYEDEPRWAAACELMEAHRARDYCETRFSDAELASSRWMRLQADWYSSYPEPSGPRAGSHGWVHATYDTTGYCEDCGIKGDQVAPFRVARPPRRLGKGGLASFHWVTDVFFLPTEVWEQAFAPLGIGCWPLLTRRGDREQEGVVQLRIEARLQRPLSIEGYPSTVCDACGRRRYDFIRTGTFPGLNEEPLAPIVQTREWFGAGGQSHRATLISAEVYRALRAHGVRGARLMPVTGQMG